MLIERRIKLNDTDYLIGLKIKYDQTGRVTKIDDSYFDFGDFRIMIEYFEEKYNKKEKYKNCNTYMNDIIYIYDKFPFLEYIKDITYDKDGKILQIGYIEKSEIQTYIKNMKITINNWDRKNCQCPLLYN